MQASLTLTVNGPLELTPEPEQSIQLKPNETRIVWFDAQAADVQIAGDFNGWIPDRDVQSHIETEGIDRVWTKVMLLPPGTYQYRYVVDGEWRVDPENGEHMPGPMGQPNSVLHVS